MYLITAYFDEKTNKTLQRWIDQVASASGNHFMADHKVPPHLTITSFEARAEREPQLVEMTKLLSDRLCSGDIQFVSIGALLPYVLYATPVLNQYLQNLQEQVFATFSDLGEVRISRFYQPYRWLPHVTLGKTLDKEQMQLAFAAMQNRFAPFEGRIVELGLAKVNPHEDLIRIRLEQ